MKNKETYAKELAGIPFSELAMTKDGKICHCDEILCRDCAFYERKFTFCREAERVETVVHTEIARLQAEKAELLGKTEKLETELAELRARLDKAVELPVKVGDIVYNVVYDETTNDTGWHLEMYEVTNDNLFLMCHYVHTRLVFLVKEEAEKRMNALNCLKRKNI